MDQEQGVTISEEFRTARQSKAVGRCSWSLTSRKARKSWNISEYGSYDWIGVSERAWKRKMWRTESVGGSRSASDGNFSNESMSVFGGIPSAISIVVMPNKAASQQDSQQGTSGETKSGCENKAFFRRS